MITEKTLVQRALNCYDNPQCITVEEFKSDLDRFSSIKKLITKYKEGYVLQERLILNHLVICFNVFGPTSVLILLHKVDREKWGILFPFLILLNRLPDHIPEYNLQTSDIALDTHVITTLRNL